MMRSYTIAKKIEVVQWHRQAGRNVHETSRHFNIDRKRIREWDGKYESLLQQNFGKSKLRRKLSNGAPVFSEELDDALFEFFERERSAGRAVSNRLLAEEALRIARSLQLGNFHASTHYIARWKQRFSISMRQATNESQKTPDDYAEAAHAFRSSVNELRLCHGYTPFNMANMDQTMVRMDCPASRTNNNIGESSVRITNTGCARRGFTVSLTACASGHKLPAFVILKEPSGKIPTKAFMKLRVPANVRVTASKNGWMSSDKFQEWLSRVWGPNTDDVRRLLVLDQAPIHKTQAARDALDERETDVAYVPACCTSILQPADVYWNRPFKANLRRSWEEFMRRAEKTPKGNLRKPSHQDVLDFVAAAWEAVSEETVAKSFKGCGISNALDGSEEGCLHGRLSDVGTVPPEHRDGLQAECCSLFFDTDSEDSFDGFQ
ncbi:pogo transposable element with KRAB domain [Rhipicephalus sanguineus]|uniref:pogo transposable element with KRAB domain n=1 Tax=Rhipicephalus sanguineus TaxID=34632 RepID=UPI0020C26FBE|nr:pogo transposable element with KRAB domain [Rhipicephalus sanguineus]